MKNIIPKLVLLGSIVTSTFACNSAQEKNTTATADKATPAAIDNEKVKAEIQAKEDEFAATYNSGELKKIGYYADDAVTFYPNRAPLQGKEAIVDFLKADLVANSNTILFKTNEVFVSTDGNQVVEIGNYKLLDSAKTTLNTGNYMSLFEKRDGKYVCVRDMSASVVPLP